MIAYPVTVTNGVGGSNFVTGDVVTLTANDPPDGQLFKSWVITPSIIPIEGTSLNSKTIKFVMPSGAVNAVATTSSTEVPPDTGGGGVLPSQPTSASDTEETQDQPDSDDSFIDVSPDAWYYDDVMYVFRNGLMNGTSESPMLFSPILSTTRGMIVTILYRLMGSPDASALPNPFDDVAAGTWYYDAVKWAAANGIVKGYGDGKYGPADDITREQLASILDNYAEFAGLNLPAVKEYQAFADNSNIAGYAGGAVERLFKAGVIGGKPGNIFDPKGKATRAEVAAMLTRFITASGG